MDPTLAGTAPGRRGPTWVPIAAAAALFVIVIGLIVGLDWGRGSDSRIFGLTCPRAYRVGGATAWVPTAPKGVNGAARLARVNPPAVVVICAYRPAAPASGSAKLAGHRGIGGDLTQVSGTLAWVPGRPPGGDQSCVGGAATGKTGDYLIGLSYAKGSGWVSVPAGACAGNGRFQAAADLGDWARAAYRSGHWVPAPPGPPAPNPATCTPAGAGRLGTESTMVPTGAVSVDVCAVVDGKVSAHTRGTAADAAHLTAALNAAPTSPDRSPTTTVCRGRAASTASYATVFHYPLGTDTAVRVAGPDCSPLVDNGLLSSQGATRAGPLLAALIARK